MIGTRFDNLSTSAPDPAPQNGNGTHVPDARPQPPSVQPKPKVSRPMESDAAMAARLQAEESARARPTRGGGVKKRPAIKKRKKVSAAKIKSADDSELSSLEDGEPKERKGGFHVGLALIGTGDIETDHG